ncbi:MAG: ATP-binding protein, partial [Pseudomonadota bacterium]
MPIKLKKKSGLYRLVRRLAPQGSLVMIIAFMVGLGSFLLDQPQIARAVLVCAAALFAMALMVNVLSAWYAWRQRAMVSSVAGFLQNDSAPSLMTDASGAIMTRNRAADERFSTAEARSLAECFSGLFANPAPILFRLQNKAMTLGAARDDIVTRRGHVRLAVHALTRDSFLWRLEDIVERGPVAPGGSPAQTLSLPMMTVSASGAILFMNDALRKLVGGRVKSLDRIFRNLPIRSGQMNQVSSAEGTIACLVAEVEATGGRREIFLLPGTMPDTDVARDGWSFFDELPVALLKMGADGEIMATNRPARELLKRPVKVGANLADILESLGRSVRDWVEDAAAGKGLGHPEFLQVTDAEEDVFVQVMLNRVKEDGETVIIAVLNDATELKSLEKQFVQSQKMQAIGQLAGGVAHDFNNLLTAIAGHCDLLLLRHDASDADYADLMQIHQNTNRAASLVSQLLAFSRKQNLRPEALDMRDTLSDMGHLLNRLVGERVTLEQDHPTELPQIRADKRQLEQVLMNLVVNARDAMPEGGRIRISTEAQVLTEPLERGRALVPAGEYLLVHVKDEGVGIAADKHAQIFEPFFTTKKVGEGTGLGLSTAYGIVKQSGGFIFLESAPGLGTTFTLYFPALEAKTAPQAPRADTLVELPAVPKVALPRDDSAKGTVLLVEDEAPVRAFASRALRLRGFTVLEADSAEAALHTLKDADVSVDIFVTDVVMPGQDGPSWVQEALQERPNTKVVFVSGYAKETFSERQAEIPNSVFLAKPFSLNELTSVVQSALAGPAPWPGGEEKLLVSQVKA